MKFKINISAPSPEVARITDDLENEMLKEGHEKSTGQEPVDFVLNFFDLSDPKSYLRKSSHEKVVSIGFLKEEVPDMKSFCYVALVKTLSNILFCILITGNKNTYRCFRITPEVGFSGFSYDPGKIYSNFFPVICSNFIYRNRISGDLLLSKDHRIPELEDMVTYSRILKNLGALPAPFLIEKFLDRKTIDHLFRLYQIRGLSYGNLSIRNHSLELHPGSFWMTARGVDKSNLKGPGLDILLVTGFDKNTGEMLVSVPGEYNPKIRVSVDAIMHHMIYREFPGTGAIVHIHAWLEGVLSTTQVYPCGTTELAENVTAMLRASPEPERSAIGLKNHGITITGPDIKDIFNRITDKLILSVPIYD